MKSDVPLNVAEQNSVVNFGYGEILLRECSAMINVGSCYLIRLLLYSGGGIYLRHRFVQRFTVVMQPGTVCCKFFAEKKTVAVTIKGEGTIDQIMNMG